MKKASNIDRKFNSKVALATLCLATAGWMTAQAQNSPNTPAPVTGPNLPAASQSQTITQNRLDQGQSETETTTNPAPPQRMNKCSNLIGSTVENPQGDKLGKIDEVVVDFNSGRVSYCVMTLEHKIFSTPKYLALPISALQPAADGTRLVLNADKDKIAQAEGIDRDNWPSVNNPAWGAQPFWQSAPKACIPGSTDQIKNTPSGTSGTSH